MKTMSVLALLFALIRVSPAQSPKDGHIAGHSYVNTYLHFTYSWPSILQPKDPASLNFGPHPNPNEWLLFAAQQGNEPYGILMLVEKLNAPWHNFPGFKDGADFIRRVPAGATPEERFKILESKHSTTAAGLVFDEMDYISGGVYHSGIAIQTGGYIIVFKCDGKSLADLAAMTGSALATSSVK
ncbi:MAG TPA: hypothetical protein VN678_05835 [Acidobacteriaceae bacterium]|nr:hypothetical protein [Acidobacteriaceae bacterium]